ncbi:MAG: hypothetical protein QOF33_2870, partial [Thermomicrobiales bacterium]|nr:hypothetical protein [Thermomicrobiales bacterium]
GYGFLACHLSSPLSCGVDVDVTASWYARSKYVSGRESRVGPLLHEAELKMDDSRGLDRSRAYQLNVRVAELIEQPPAIAEQYG